MEEVLYQSGKRLDKVHTPPTKQSKIVLVTNDSKFEIPKILKLLKLFLILLTFAWLLCDTSETDIKIDQYAAEGPCS